MGILNSGTWYIIPGRFSKKPQKLSCSIETREYYENIKGHDKLFFKCDFPKKD